MAQNNTKLIATQTACILEKGNIPSVLYSWLAMNLAGVETESLEVELVIMDSHLDAADAVLTGKNFPACADPKCLDLNVRRRRIGGPERLWRHAVPAWHTHLGSVADQWLDLHPTKILNPNSFTEAAILLFCRNACHYARLGLVYSYMLAALSEAELTNDQSRRVVRRLRPEFQPAWDCLNGRYPPGTDPNAEMRKLRGRLMARGELGAMPPEQDPAPESKRPPVVYLSELRRERQERRSG
ncbi:hypothetical protein BJY01DRAFT_163718 [Aspergillus pseudoustus]|uniref:Uncharacterized protein n=1 Tax=Aspergillus pseudoustus TaxID=1810923 RepID=A0ABR4K683_9EURO